MLACIVGLGARTPLGLRAFPSGVAAHAGIGRIREHPFMKDKAGEPFMLGLDGRLEGGDRNQRMLALAQSAVDEVLAFIPTAPSVPLPIYPGLPEYGPFFDEQRATALCRRLGASLVHRCQPQVLAVPEGNAAGLVALERAITALQGRLCDVCIVGGVDSFVDADLLEQLDDEGRLLSTANRWGFPPGEGAGMLAVCSPWFAQTNRLRVLGSIASVATTVEPNRMNTKTVCLGEGLGQAMAQAAAAAGTRVGRQYCDIDGERYREHELAYALQRVPPGTFENAVDYEGPADRWGNVGAATAPLLTLLPVVTVQRHLTSSAWPMVWCGSESGRRGAMVLYLEPGETPWCP